MKYDSTVTITSRADSLHLIAHVMRYEPQPLYSPDLPPGVTERPKELGQFRRDPVRKALILPSL